MTAGQVAKWKAALAEHHRQQRQQRGRKRDASSYRPGMARISLPAADETAKTLTERTTP
jgi:hypothetical protein